MLILAYINNYLITDEKYESVTKFKNEVGLTRLANTVHSTNIDGLSRGVAIHALLDGNRLS